MTASPASEPRVVWAGAQRDVLAGDLRATIGLGALRHHRHLYALGPLEGLRGEISVFDGAPTIARVSDGEVALTREPDALACFLVYADVPSWRWTAVEAPLVDDEVAARLGRHLVEAGSAGAGAPIAFLVRGTATALAYHVLDKRDGLPHSPERHEAAKVHFALRDREVEVVGFHSTAHRGVFTPRDSDVHMHFRSADGRTSGHVERLALAPGWSLGRAASASTPAERTRT